MNGSLTFYKRIGSAECDDFRGTFAGPGKPPGPWTILTRPSKLQSLGIQPIIVEFKDPSELQNLIAVQSKSFPYLELKTDTKGVSSYTGNLDPEAIINWITDSVDPENVVGLETTSQTITNSLSDRAIEPINEPTNDAINEPLIDSIINSPIEEVEFIGNESSIYQPNEQEITGKKVEGKKLEQKEETQESGMTGKDLERLVINMNDDKFIGNSIQNLIKDYPWLPYAVVLVVSAGVTAGVVAGTALRNKYGGDEGDDDLGPLLISADGSKVDFKSVWSSLDEEESKYKIKKNSVEKTKEESEKGKEEKDKEEK
jgi:hypothetical protein